MRVRETKEKRKTVGNRVSSGQPENNSGMTVTEGLRISIINISFCNKKIYCKQFAVHLKFKKPLGTSHMK